jgi:xanthine dehydrogenase YagT iron-sulfur-binding subunit
MSLSHRNPRLETRAPPVALTLGAGRALNLDIFEGEAVVLGLFARAGTVAFCEGTLGAMRAELRGLGAVLVLISPDGVWCFRPDDDLELLASTGEIVEAELAAVFNAYGLAFGKGGGGPDGALYVIDHQGRVQFQRYAEPGDTLGELLSALRAAGRALSEPARPFALSRREVLISSLVAGFTLALIDGCAKTSSAPAPPTQARGPTVAGGEVDVALDVNGVLHRLRLEPRVTLLDALRERLALTGTKKGCDQGQCGACTVLVNGRRINSCLTLAIMVEGEKIVTIEGLAQGERLHPVQQAFITEDAFQCGYCTPGQIMSAVGLLREKRATSAAEIREHMSGNICRCGAYPNIVAAIQRAGKEV